MKRKTLIYILIIIGLTLVSLIFFNQVQSVKVGDILKDSEFNNLIWSDEFNGNESIDSTKWFQQTKLPPGGSWWGGIIQHYTIRKENTYIKNGNLHIAAIKEPFEVQGELKQYTSARLNSKFAFTYGRVEARAKLPLGFGTWPAIWMLSKNINEDGAYWQRKGFGKINWPNCGEIDIMEHWGRNQNHIQSAVHTASSYGDIVTNHGGQQIADVSNKFHLYAIEWNEDRIIFSVDNKVHYIYEPVLKNNQTWPYDSDQYILLNIAIEQDIDPDFKKSEMEIDFIRVYQ